MLIRQHGVQGTSVAQLVAASGTSAGAIYHHFSGKNAVVIGRSNVVGKPLANLLLAQNATVTVCHSRTTNIAEITKQADIIVAAVGVPAFVTADMVKEGAVVVDVGINLVDGKLVGDVEPAVAEKAGAFTPVPGGIGTVTTTMMIKALLRNYL